MANNFDYKSLTIEELQYVFSDVSFPLEPMYQQYTCMALATNEDRVAFLLDVGTGKTLAALYTTKLWKCKKTLVVCPSSAFGSWRRDLEANTNFSYEFLTGSGRERKRALKKEKDIYIIAYTGLKTVYAKLIKKVGWKILLDSFVHEFDNVILDEIHKCKTWDALQSEICVELSKRAKHMIGLTGTPLDKSYLELFNIYKVIDLGKSLGSNFFAYRFKHFNKRICGSKYGRKWVEWDLKPGHEQELLDKVASISISFSREECFELPPIQKIFKFIASSTQFRLLQKGLIDNESLYSLDKEIVIGSKIKDKAFALRELPSGFFYYGKDKQVCRLKKNPKTEALIDLLEDSSSKVIVFYSFCEERNIIEKALKKEKISFCSAYGGQDADGVDREKEIARFQKDEKVKILVSQVTVASEGFDGFAANVIVFFSPLSSPKMIKQCIGRAYRKGQERGVLVVTFVMEDSIEEHVIVNRGERFSLVREAEVYMRNFHKDKETKDV